VANQNLVRGLFMAGVALFFFVQAIGYSLGNTSRPGPGLFPLVVSSLLLLISVVIAIRSGFIERVPLELKFKNVGLIISAILAFAFLTMYVNMLSGIVAMTIIASFASADFSIFRTAKITTALCAVALAMKFGLRVNLPLY
jgi:Tripartite tricarboxylate transporter TctB family